MDGTQGLKRHCIEELRKRLPSITHVIKTRNSPQSTYLRDLSQPQKRNVQHDVYKCLDLATSFKGLTIVTFTDEKVQPQTSTSKQNELRPFPYPSPSPSPTTTKENVEIPELVKI